MAALAPLWASSLTSFRLSCGIVAVRAPAPPLDGQGALETRAGHATASGHAMASLRWRLPLQVTRDRFGGPTAWGAPPCGKPEPQANRRLLFYTMLPKVQAARRPLRFLLALAGWKVHRPADLFPGPL